MEKGIYDIDYYDYKLPESLIAQTPYEKRDASRLMVLDKQTGLIKHEIFKDIISYLNEGDVLVLNNTKVLPARIYGIKESTNAKIEVLLLKEIEKNKWECLVKHQKRLSEGTKINFSNILFGHTLEIKENGITTIEFEYEGIFTEILDKLGAMPLPPYIKEELKDKNAYQTVYAKHLGSAAAPTAGLHFTEELLENIKAKGVQVLNVTLHVGLGTFRPVSENDIRNHEMHSEEYEITENVAKALNIAKENKKRIIAVGTTSLRTLESNYNKYGLFKACKEETNAFYYPPYKIKSATGLITNFHLPKSTLLMLVSTITSRNIIMDAYKEAIRKKYKFFSFGDAMFITDFNIKSNKKEQKKILEEVKKNEKIIDNFAILKGESNVMLSAPHAHVHSRNGKKKLVETNTETYVKLLNYYTKAHAIYTIGDSEVDPNRDEDCNYRKELIKYIKENNIQVFIDLHGLHKKRKRDIVLGTNKYSNISENETKKIVEIIKENLSDNVKVDEVYIGGKSTLSSYVHRNANITSLQIELKNKFRKFKNRPKLYNQTLITLIKIIEKLKEK